MRQVCLAQEIRNHSTTCSFPNMPMWTAAMARSDSQLLQRLGDDPGIHRLHPPHSLRGLDG